MTTIEALTTFFGWCSIINIGVLVFSMIVILALRGPISRIHSKMFGVSQANLPSAYFQYLGSYKIAIFIFNVVPYFSLNIMS
jgi:hypothetical protein